MSVDNENYKGPSKIGGTITGLLAGYSAGAFSLIAVKAATRKMSVGVVDFVIVGAATVFGAILGYRKAANTRAHINEFQMERTELHAQNTALEQELNETQKRFTDTIQSRRRDREAPGFHHPEASKAEAVLASKADAEQVAAR